MNNNLIKTNPAAYTLREIEAALNRITQEIENINTFFNIRCNVELCDCCGLTVCCCTILFCAIWVPCVVGHHILNLFTCGQREAQRQARIDAIQLSADETYAINQLRENLRGILPRNNRLFSAQSAATNTVTCIDNALTSSAISKLRPFLETLKASITSAHGVVSNIGLMPIACEIAPSPITTLPIVEAQLVTRI